MLTVLATKKLIFVASCKCGLNRKGKFEEKSFRKSKRKSFFSERKPFLIPLFKLHHIEKRCMMPTALLWKKYLIQEVFFTAESSGSQLGCRKARKDQKHWLREPNINIFPMHIFYKEIWKTGNILLFHTLIQSKKASFLCFREI